MPLNCVGSAVITLVSIFSQADPPNPQGHWSNPQGTVIIAIAPCGDALCGVVQWATDSAKADARRGGTDRLVGTEVLNEFMPKSPGRWRGRLFVPDLNKRPRAEMRLLGPDRLKVTVCGAAGLMCRSQVWVRTGQPQSFQ